MIPKSTNPIKVLLNLRSIIRANNMQRIPMAVVAYYLYCKKLNKSPILLDSEFANIKWSMPEGESDLKIADIIGNKFDTILQDTEADDFARIIIKGKETPIIVDPFSTPMPVINLAGALLNIEDNDTVVDMGCGRGNFLLNIAKGKPTAKYFGYDISKENVLVTKIREEIFKKYDLIPNEAEIKVENKNVFDLKKELFQPKGHKFKKIFFHYPFDTPKTEVPLEADIEKYFSTVPFANWAFNYLICCMLEEHGKGIAIMPNGSTINYTERKIRKYFLDNGFIEAVIALPDKMLEFSNMNSVLVIFSNNPKNKEGVYMYKCQNTNDKMHIFDKKDIDKVLAEYHKDGQFIPMTEISERNGYNLHPNTYINGIDRTNSVPFESLTDKITRASHLLLDSESEENKNDGQKEEYFYLNSSNIRNGVIDFDDMIRLKSIPDKNKEFVIRDNTLIITKNAPYKIAYVDKVGERRILVSGNFYLIKLKEKEVNPYFVKAFLESKKGMDLLELISSGSFIHNISLNALKSMPFPLISLEKQNEIARKYCDAVAKFLAKEAELKAVQAELSQIRDNMLGE